MSRADEIDVFSRANINSRVKATAEESPVISINVEGSNVNHDFFMEVKGVKFSHESAETDLLFVCHLVLNRMNIKCPEKIIEKLILVVLEK